MCGMPSALVIGAGVVGLSTAICLQSRGFKVTVVADRFGVDTTSWIAGGLFLPYSPDSFGVDKHHLAVDVVKRSWKHFADLEKSVENGGVMKVFGYQLYFTNAYGEELLKKPLAWEVVDVLRSCSKEELMSLIPTNPCSGWIIQTYIIQPWKYLPYLMDKFRSNGGIVIEKTVRSLEEFGGYDVIMNCSGLGAAQICGDNSVYPVRGQVVRVQIPHLKYFFHCEDAYDRDRKMIYAIPQAEHVLVGGTYNEKNGSLLAEPETKEKLLEGLTPVLPNIKQCPVLLEQCGLRPGRCSVRLEREQLILKSGKKLQIIHNYGHGGNGISFSWGTAELAADMAISAVTSPKL